MLCSTCSAPTQYSALSAQHPSSGPPSKHALACIATPRFPPPLHGGSILSLDILALCASDGLVPLFDLLGSAVFGFVQNDIKGTVHGVRTRFNAAPDTSLSGVSFSADPSFAFV
ncbi:hypothetical protein AB1N83_010909 [Pleurotus pulmonarius]